jgi:hypothetical protein
MSTEKKKSVFETLNAINVNEHVEKKNGLTYLSWAWAWQVIKQNYPDAFYTIYENAQGLFYHTDGRTAWVKTGVTINGQEHIEYLPVMDHRNRSIPADALTSYDVNKTIQRSLTKACARHGLGLYIYAGEDIPEEERLAQRSASNETESKAVDEIRGAETIESVSAIYKGYQKTNPDICRKGGALYTAAMERANELKQTA